MADGHGSDSLRNLHKILLECKPSPKPLPLPAGQASPLGQKFSATDFLQERYLLGLDCDEVYPSIYIGDEGAAKNKDYLRSLGITHVLNAAEGLHVGQVDTNAAFYHDIKLKYHGLSLMDFPDTRISNYFEEACAFIDTALNNDGKILVHCVMGLSRSATIVIAYLMSRKGLNAEAALRAVRTNRDIRPNDGFLEQLVEYDRKLRRKNSPQHSSL